MNMKTKFNLRTVNVTRYISREGGSLPALAEADDDFKYVLKFKGAGHGVKALIAGGRREIARVLKLQIPELVYANLDEALVVPKPTRKSRFTEESRFKFSLHFPF
jgi:hypothetical protein